MARYDPIERAAGVAILGLASMFSACAEQRAVFSPPAAGAASPNAAKVLGEADVRRVIDVVTAARQLAPKRAIVAQRVDRKTFLHLLHDEEDEDEGTPSPELSPGAAFVLGFNLLPPPERRAGLATAREVLSEEVAGFYDPRKDAVFVPIVPVKTEREALMQRAVLAHEAEHALQHQHFDPPKHPEERDARLAELALWEGDAMVSMGAYLGAEQGEPIGRTLRRITDVTRDVSVEKLAGERKARAVDRAAPILREQLEFPYLEGMSFVSDLYRAGGFPLVNEAFRSPPSSTMHILHPDKYLGGIEPRSFADVPPPPGSKRVASGTLGEMLTRLIVSNCLDRERGARAADGWAGDRYTVFATPKRELSFAWVSAWDSAADAEDFQQAIGASGKCFGPNRLGDSIDYTIGADIRVSRQDKVVVVLREVASPMVRNVEAALFASLRSEVPPRPRSSARIPPREVLPPPQVGRLQGDLYTNDWLGVHGRIPPGMNVNVGKDDMEISISRPDVVVHGGLVISTRIANGDQQEKAFREVYEGFASALRKHGIDLPLVVRANGTLRTSLGNAVERTWSPAGTQLELRMIMVPICAGTGSLVFVQAYADPYARTVLDGWMNGFRFMRGRNVEACKYLDPK